MDVNQPLALLGGLSPVQFMRRHWQKKPLLIRQAIPGFKPVLSRSALFALAASDEVESRLIVQRGGTWTLKQGPLTRRSLPPVRQPGWSLLVQGVDGHDERAHELLQKFRFVPDARLDDLMISYASAGGGVGPHFDSYDVFLLQASGRRRWKTGRQKDLSLQAGMPLKILQNFQPDEEFVLDAGDMLYLPPAYAHDGVSEASVDADGAVADCMTYSVGFRSPARQELAARLLHRLAEFTEDDSHASEEEKTSEGGNSRRRYRDRTQPATAAPAAIPSPLLAFAREAVRDALKDPLSLACALGELLTEPAASVYFEPPVRPWAQTKAGKEPKTIHLDTRTRMMYDAQHVFMNGESYRARGPDAKLMRHLADQRELSSRQLMKASPAAIALLGDWHSAGWASSALGSRSASCLRLYDLVVNPPQRRNSDGIARKHRQLRQ